MTNSIYLTDKKPILLSANNHAEWLNNRRNGIGSSDVATILGCNKYASPYQLWLNKRAVAPKENENFLMKMGHKLEPIIADLWQEETGRKIEPWSESEYMYVHPELDFLRASPDREFEGGGILECKSTQLKVDADTLPEYWFSQVQYQMGIAQKDHCNIAWLISGREFGYAEVDFNPEFYRYMIDEVTRFWRVNVIGGKEPELTCGTDLMLKYAYDDGRSIEVNEDVYDIYTELNAKTAELKAIEVEVNELKERAKLSMGAAQKAIYNGQTLFTWKTGKARETLDSKRLKAEHPDIYADYTKVSQGGRTFLIK